MGAPAAIKATFADYKRVRGRKVGQLIFEVPLEELHAAIAKLGGEPSTEHEPWCGIARLEAAAAATQPAGKKRWHDLPLSQQAAMRCSEVGFQRFLVEEHGSDGMGDDCAAHAVRSLCHVQSRADIKPGSAAGGEWRRLDDQYQLWLRDIAA